MIVVHVCLLFFYICYIYLAANKVCLALKLMWNNTRRWTDIDLNIFGVLILSQTNIEFLLEYLIKQTDGQTDRKNANVWQWLWTFFAIENPRFWHQDDCVFLSDARFWHCFGTLNWCLLHNQFTWHYHDVFCCFCFCFHLWVNCFQLDFYANLQDFKRNSNVVFCYCRTTIRTKS